MNTQKIDVLAFLDGEIASAIGLSADAYYAQELQKRQAVRAAVAELIAAGHKVQEQVAPLLEKNGYIHVGAMDRHRRAIACIGGAA